jgi:hypothetical protein
VPWFLIAITRSPVRSRCSGSLSLTLFHTGGASQGCRDPPRRAVRPPGVACSVRGPVRSGFAKNIAVVHRLSDLEAAGARNSEQVKLARGLLSDSQTKVVFRQEPAELPLVRELYQLSERETAVVAAGSALWKVGSRSFQVEHVLSAFEREITWTDERVVV